MPDFSMKYPAKIHFLPIEEIHPAPENTLLYRPVNPDTPEIIDLAASIEVHGILEPLTVTKDRIIVSGHRRHAAARLAGLTEVPARVLDLESTDPRFTDLLVEYNRQRVKTLDEFLREAIAYASPDQEYQALIEHREARAGVNHSLERIELREFKSRKRISPAKYPMLTAVREILEENRNYWPLSDRQIHYRLLVYMVLRHASKPDQVYVKDRKTGLISPRSNIYINNSESYNDLTDLLTRARLEGLIPFEAIVDETRPVVIWDVHQNPQSFTKGEIDNFLKGYWRDLLQSQPNHIELVGEKLTIEGTIRPVLMHYTIPYTIGRGYASLDPRHKLIERFRASGKERLILLYLSDFDPDGDEIAHSFVRSLRDDFDLDEQRIEPIRVALTRAQIRDFRLLPVMQAKEESATYNRFVERHGDTVVHELDALTPARLQNVLTHAIDSVLDIDAFNAELEREKEDSVWLSGVRQTVFEALRGLSLE
jgi:hypothetical protein